jgi:hypothetical protein
MGRAVNKAWLVGTKKGVRFATIAHYISKRTYGFAPTGHNPSLFATSGAFVAKMRIVRILVYILDALTNRGTGVRHAIYGMNSAIFNTFPPCPPHPLCKLNN